MVDFGVGIMPIHINDALRLGGFPGLGSKKIDHGFCGVIGDFGVVKAVETGNFVGISHNGVILHRQKSLGIDGNILKGPVGMVYEVFDQGHQRFTHFCDGFFSVASGLILKGEALKGIMSQYIWVDTDGKGTVTGFCGNGFCKVTVGIVGVCHNGDGRNVL
ncbi:MAG: hypothetical protein EUB_03819 [Eubacterium sp.]